MKVIRFLKLSEATYGKKSEFAAKEIVYGLAVASTSDASPGLIRKGVIDRNREVWDITLEI
jgi:hypothetical protein